MSVALELWRILEAWDAARHPRGPGGRFIKVLGAASSRPSLGDVVHGTAALGPKRQRRGGAGLTVADAVRDAARLSDSTGRPTSRPVAEHRAHGAHDVADEVERALADAGVSEDVRRMVAGRARAAADSHGARPDSLPAAAAPAMPRRSPEQLQRDIFLAVQDLVRDDPGGWTGLADVRDAVDAPKQDVDEALIALLDTPGVRIIPVANTKALKPRDREAAVRIGGEDNHAISIDPNVAPPALKRSAPSMSAAPANVSPPSPAELDSQVWDAYHELATDPGAFVALDRLRERLEGNGASKADVDKSLERLLDIPEVQLEPEDNQKTLTAEDRAAAVFIGGENRHLLQIRAGARRPSPTAAAPSGFSKSGVDLSTVRGAGAFSTDPEIRAAAIANIARDDAVRKASNERLRAAGKIADAPSEVEVAATRAETSSTISAADAYGGYQAGLAAFGEEQRKAWGMSPSAAASKPAAPSRPKRTPVKKAAPPAAPKAPAAAPSASTAGRNPGYDGLDPRQLDVILGDNDIDAAGMSREQKLAALAAKDARIGVQRFPTVAAGDVVSSKNLGSAERTEIGGWKGGRSPSGAGRSSAVGGDHETAVRDAYTKLAGQPGDWVGMADLRDQMGHLSRDEQDQALKRLMRQSGVQIEEETNQKTLRQRDRDAAINIGGRAQHVVSIAPPPAPRGRSAGSLAGARAATDDARRQLADAIVNAPSRDAVRSAVAKLNVRELRALAGELGATVGSKDTKPKIINRLAEIAGRRLDAAAIDRMARGT